MGRTMFEMGRDLQERFLTDWSAEEVEGLCRYLDQTVPAANSSCDEFELYRRAMLRMVLIYENCSEEVRRAAEDAALKTMSRYLCESGLEPVMAGRIACLVRKGGAAVTLVTEDGQRADASKLMQMMGIGQPWGSFHFEADSEKGEETIRAIHSRIRWFMQKEAEMLVSADRDKPPEIKRRGIMQPAV